MQIQPVGFFVSGHTKTVDYESIKPYILLVKAKGRAMTSRPKRVCFYLRVSTDDQTIENQRRELTKVAERHGWEVVAEFKDEGISGAKGRDKRPGFDALCKGVSRREFDMIASWSVDRLGRSLQGLVEFLGEVHAKGVDLYLHQQSIDTTTPTGKAMFQMMGVFAEFERSMIVGRVNAGLARAKAEPRSARLEKLRKGKIKQLAFGRPSKFTPVKTRKAREMLNAGVGVNKIADTLDVGTGTIFKLKTILARTANGETSEIIATALKTSVESVQTFLNNAAIAA
jgi:DNA invertase Pin-like site-specific DNA recombinase